jgi:FMN-dependent NADH-azoreductase
MPRLLQLDSSADLDGSRTRRLTDEFARAWTARGPEYTVVRRDLHTDPLPHLRVVAQHWPERLRGGQTVPGELDALQQSVIDELLAADALVIGAPMYNYSMPSTLKTWIDLVHVPGTTVPFDVAAKPLEGRPAVVMTARGGAYDERPADGSWDPVSSALRLLLGESMGMEVTVVATNRTLADTVPDLDPAIAQSELDNALARARELAAAV